MKAITGKVLVKMDTRQKEKYALTKDVQLFIEKGYNFNKREDSPSMGIVIDGNGMPHGAECLCHHNSSDPTYIVDYEEALTEEEISEGYKVLSVPIDMVFCYKENDEWIPCKDFLITQRIFKPYLGKLTGIEHEQVKNRMYVVKGQVRDEDEKEIEYMDVSGKVMVTLVNTDYQIIFHNKDHREESLIRSRNREMLAMDEKLLSELKEGKCFVGLTNKDCRPLQEK